jgi:hypothetical protein
VSPKSRQNAIQEDKLPSTRSEVDLASSLEDFLSAWWYLSGGAHGVVHGWQMSAKRKGLSEFLRAYQTTNGQLPRGTFTFKFISLSTAQEVEETLDADVVHNKVTSRAAAVRS